MVELATNGLKECVQARTELIKLWPELIDLIFCQQVSSECSPEPVLGFVQRTASDANKPAIFLIRSATVAFGDIRTNAICCPNELFPDSVPREVIPRQGNVPNLISDVLRKLIDAQVFKISSRHRLLPAA